MEKKNGYYTSDWFFGPALPDYLFHEGEREEDSVEYHQSDVATVFELMKIQIPKMLGMMTRRVKQRSNRLKNYEDFMIVICSLDALSIIML